MCVCVRVVCGVCDFICITPCSYDNKVENYRVRRNDKAHVSVWTMMNILTTLLSWLR